MKEATKTNLNHQAKAAMLARWAKYNDPTNHEWEWKDTQKYERHAINAVLDLVDAEERIAHLEAETAKQQLIPEALVDEVQRRMDAVVEAAVEWHQSGSDSTAEQFTKADTLGKAIDNLLELREQPQKN